jgi:hypothetical protein
MKRYDIYLDPDEVKKLGDLPGTVSEYVRQAIREFLQRIEGKNVSASASRKRGEQNG